MEMKLAWARGNSEDVAFPIVVSLFFFLLKRGKETLVEGAGENDTKHFLQYLRKLKTKMIFQVYAKMS